MPHTLQLSSPIVPPQAYCKTEGMRQANADLARRHMAAIRTVEEPSPGDVGGASWPRLTAHWGFKELRLTAVALPSEKQPPCRADLPRPRAVATRLRINGSDHIAQLRASAHPWVVMVSSEGPGGATTTGPPRVPPHIGSGRPHPLGIAGRAGLVVRSASSSITGGQTEHASGSRSHLCAASQLRLAIIEGRLRHELLVQVIETL